MCTILNPADNDDVSGRQKGKGIGFISNKCLFELGSMKEVEEILGLVLSACGTCPDLNAPARRLGALNEESLRR